MTLVKVKPSRHAARRAALRDRLESAIAGERKRLKVCAFRFQSLKRLTLKVKDEIQAVKTRTAAWVTAFVSRRL